MYDRLVEVLFKLFGMQSKRWRVQAFLSPAVTQGEEFGYAPTIHTTKFAARKQVVRLKQSFPAGDVRIVCERIRA